MATTFGLEMHPARNIPMCVIPSVNLLILAGPRAQHGFGFEVLLNDVQEV